MAIIRRCKVCRRAGQPYSSIDHCEHKEAVWAVKYRVNRRQVLKTVGPNKREAERYLTTIKSEINTGGGFIPITPILMRELSDIWFENKIARDKKPATQKNYQNVLHRHLLPSFGALLVSQITPLKIEALKTDLRKKLAAKSVNNILIILGSILRYGRIIKCMKENPMEGIEFLREKRVESAFLTQSEVGLLIKHSNEPYRTLFFVAVCTGLRSGELLALQWRDINWMRSVISVRRSLYWGSKDERFEDDKPWTFTEPKSRNSTRAVFMIPLVTDALKEHQKTSPKSRHDLVFCTKYGNPLSRSNVINREFHPALKRAKLPIIRFHDLRHSNASWMLGAGENAAFVSKHLGHSSINVTVDIYHHVMPQEIRDVSDRLQKSIVAAL